MSCESSSRKGRRTTVLLPLRDFFGVSHSHGQNHFASTIFSAPHSTTPRQSTCWSLKGTNELARFSNAITVHSTRIATIVVVSIVPSYRTFRVLLNSITYSLCTYADHTRLTGPSSVSPRYKTVSSTAALVASFYRSHKRQQIRGVTVRRRNVVYETGR